MPLYFSSNNSGNCDVAAMESSSTAPAATSTTTATSITTRPPNIIPYVSSRTQETLDPCVILMKQLISQHANKWATNDADDKHQGIYSLAQGVVYWRPPSSAYESLIHAVQQNIMSDTDANIDGNQVDGRLLHTYCPDEGYPPLLSALQYKLQKENGLSNPHVIVTSGANQAYVNCVLTLLDERKCGNDASMNTDMNDGTPGRGRSNVGIDKCVVFEPYYFNHVMAIQSVRGGRGCGGTAMMADTDVKKKSLSTPTSSCTDTTMTEEGVEGLLVGPTIRGVPDLKWLQSKLEEYQSYDHDDATNTTTRKNSIRMVTLVNPGNPTGISLPYYFLKEVVQLTKEYGVWLIVDNTYEHFDVDGENRIPPMDVANDVQQQPDFPCFDEEHVINIFSFSKGFAMAGFRVGYIALSSKSANDGVGAGTVAYNEMLKVQDTIAICASRISQMAALGALQAGREWVYEQVTTLDVGRAAIRKAMSSLEDLIGGNGAMYIMGKLPNGVDDREFASSLVEHYGVAVIPGSFCGLPGWIRVCYSNLPPEECCKAASRLDRGIAELLQVSK